MGTDQRTLNLEGFAAGARAGLLLSRDYAGPCIRLLMNYKSISASEAASRLELHIKTAQDFLDGLTDLGVLRKENAREDKRPYFRYSVLKTRLRIGLDLEEFTGQPEPVNPGSRLREVPGSGAVFHEGRDQSVRSVTVFRGEGRRKIPNRINLTRCQGKFLFHLPFPTQDPLTAGEIASRAGLDIKGDCLNEIMDIIRLLIDKRVIEEREWNSEKTG